MNKSRQTFDPQKYQKPSRENLTKANNTLLHYRTSLEVQNKNQQKNKDIRWLKQKQKYHQQKF